MSASFLVYMLAAAFLGPASAFVSAVVSEAAATRMMPTRRQAFLFNLVGVGFTALLAGTLLRKLAPAEHSVGSIWCSAGWRSACSRGWLILAPLYIAYDGYSETWSPRTLVDYLPSAAINVALTVAGAAIFVEVGLAGIAFALAAALAFSYMAHLLNDSPPARRAVRLAVVGRPRRLCCARSTSATSAPPGTPRPWPGSRAIWPRRSE